jgi:hypothetical protein
VADSEVGSEGQAVRFGQFGRAGSEYQRNIQFSKPNGSARLSLLGYQTWKEEDGAATRSHSQIKHTLNFFRVKIMSPTTEERLTLTI